MIEDLTLSRERETRLFDLDDKICDIVTSKALIKDYEWQNEECYDAMTANSKNKSVDLVFHLNDFLK